MGHSRSGPMECSMNRHKPGKIQREKRWPCVMLFMQHNTVHIAIGNFFDA
jgi:hypothetical protein